MENRTECKQFIDINRPLNKPKNDLVTSRKVGKEATQFQVVKLSRFKHASWERP